MQQIATYIYLIIMGTMPLCSYGYTASNQNETPLLLALVTDTIPPVFTQPPRDTSVNCTSPLQDHLTSWYRNQAGALADDGEASIFCTIPLSQAQDSLEDMLTRLCVPNDGFVLSFFAIDSCGNRSAETLDAQFKIFDLIPPNISQPAQDKEVYCGTSIADTLQQWIDTQGGAVATESCSVFDWTNYVWTDDANNSGFQSFQDSTEIRVRRSNCEWSVTVSFFCADGCGNDNLTSATFSVIADTLGPQLLTPLNDTTLLCNQAIPNEEPLVVDACDGVLRLTQSDSLIRNNQTACDQVEYELLRTWTTNDACGNPFTTSRSYFVVDTLAPTLSMSPTIAVDCDVPMDEYDQFIATDDNCGSVMIDFRDSILFDSNCQNQFIRTWIVSDPCGNVDSMNQTIQVQDFSGPEFLDPPQDLVIDCSQGQLETMFNNWINDNLTSGASDNCNAVFLKALPLDNYIDTSIINSTATISFQDFSCGSTDSIGLLSHITTSFIAYDLCGNITQVDADFVISDQEAPIISACPPDFNLQVEGGQCDAEYLLLLPAYTDDCLSSEDASWSVFIDGAEFPNVDQQGLQIPLTIGDHNIRYEISDCGGNLSFCEQEISVFDNTPPDLTCVDTLQLFLSETDCEVSLDIPELSTYSDNCFGPPAYDNTLPDESGFLSFLYNSTTDLYLAKDLFLNFENINPEGIVFRPHLRIEYYLDLDPNSRIVVRDERGREVFSTTDAQCEPQSVLIEINNNDFLSWSQDNTATFIVENQVRTGTGTQPCTATNISGLEGKDNVSYFRITMDYADIIPEVRWENKSTGASIPVTGELQLGPGNHELEYSAIDAVNNASICTTGISVLDTISPSLSCDTIHFEVDPLLQGFFPLTEADLNYSAEDNCGIASLDFNPRQVNCNDQELPYSILLNDENGNFSSCNGIISISKQQLNPTFLSGLCLADSLKFQSNIPEFSGLALQWTGPDNFSSTESNPIITGINDDASGIYTLEATTVDGCVFSGEIFIDVQQFDSPDIFSDALIICQGEELLLNTNSFNEIVEYFWYEGISPNGILISQTNGPSLSLMPTTGNHFYYVEVKGNNCNSNPSNTLEIEVTAPPLAEITDAFITQCVGDDITLMTNVFGQNFEYEWSGPDNYNSVGQFPEVITDITESNQGTYTLIIKDGGCISDTATAQVIVFPRPPLPIITGDNIYCEGQSAVLTVPNVPNGTSFQWFNNDLFYRTVSTNNLLIPSISNDESGEWRVVAEEGICTSDTSEVFDISIESSLNVGATNNGPLCEGDSVTLTTSFIPNATYLWQDPSANTFAGRIVTTLAQAGVYTVTVTTEGNCVTTTTTTVEVGIRPEITALSNTSLPCMSGSTPVTFKSTVFPPDNYSYSWTGPNGFTSNLEEPIIQNFDENDNGEYILTIIKDNCASEPMSNIIAVTLIPEQPILSGFSSPCQGDEVEITITNPTTEPGATWMWQTPSGPIITTVPTLTIPDFNTNSSGSYSAIQIVNECRSENSEDLNLLLQTEPLTPTLIGNSSICEGDDYLLEVDILNADNYIWFTPNGTITTDVNELLLEDVAINEAGSYSVFIRSGNCISDTSQFFTLAVMPIPESLVFFEDDISICNSDVSELIICTDPVIGFWDKIKLTDLQTGTTIQESDDNCFDLDFLLSSGEASYELGVVSELTGCQSINIDTLNLNISEVPSGRAEVAQDTIFLCGDDFATITVDDAPDNIQIRWDSNDPEINIFDEQSETVSLSNLRPGSNKIFLISSAGSCEAYAIDTITVIILEEPSAIDDNLELAFDQEIPISVLTNDNFTEEVNINLITNPSSGNATVNDNFVIYNPQPGLVGEEAFSYEICYDICPDLCDEATITLQIGQNVDCFAGNLISPNGDGYNDILKVPCLQTGNFENNSLVIFNEWGDEVHRAAPYQNDWAGTYNGKPLPVGTYFYILDLGDGSRALQGFLIIEL